VVNRRGTPGHLRVLGRFLCSAFGGCFFARRPSIKVGKAGGLGFESRRRDRNCSLNGFLRAVVAANKPISKAGSRARLAVPAIILRAVAEWREFSMRAVIASWRRGWLDPRATGRRRPRRSGAQAQRERWAINQRAPRNDGRAPPTLADLGSAYPRGPIKSGAAFRRSGSGADVEKAAAAFKRDCSRRYYAAGASEEI
jgi:hypothetical protein